MRQLLLLVLLLPAACARTDPYTREGAWQRSGVSERNLAAMVAEPADLVRGHGAAGANSPLAIAAVNRLLEDKVKPLPDASSQQTTVAPTGGGAGGGGGGGGAPGGS